MSDSLSGWVYLGPVNVYQASHRIKLIDPLFEVDIFDRDDETAHWAYEQVTGIPVLSNNELEDDAYHTVDDNAVNDDINESGTYNYTITVPKPFFPPGDDASVKEIAEKVDEEAYISENQRRHFVFNADLNMHEGDVRSVYLLTDDQITDRLQHEDDWGDSFGSKPQFF